MLSLTRVTESFPSISIPSQAGHLAVEVSLIAQIGHGAGDHLFASIASRQRHHAAFIDEMDEPSAKLGSTNFTKGDATSLYSFVVGPKGHPFHCHAGHRVFTAVSGSAGAQLKFSSASKSQIEQDPQNFVRALRYVNIPPDCMFTVRFGGDTWHQFSPLKPNSTHPVFCALSCHTNELGGHLDDSSKAMILAGEASIPALTELLPPSVAAYIESNAFQADTVPTTDLSLDAAPGTFLRVACNALRGGLGFLRGIWGRRTAASGALSLSGGPGVIELSRPPVDSLLMRQMPDLTVHHDDTFSLTVTGVNFTNASASQLLAAVLQGFLVNAPAGVSNLMALRNVLVKPLGLRTSPLGCPVSSLLSPETHNLFAQRYPVLDQSICTDDRRAQVVLGANDKHLMFRSCVGVKVIDTHNLEITLGTRVHCKNSFGRVYMAVIDYAHRRYISPSMLRLAVEYAVLQGESDRCPQVTSSLSNLSLTTI